MHQKSVSLFYRLHFRGRLNKEIKVIMIKTDTQKLGSKTGKKATTKEMTKRVEASFKDVVKSLEKDKLKGVIKSDVVNSSNSMGDTLDSLDNCSESIKTLDKTIDKAIEGGLSIQKQIEEIVFTDKGIDDFGVDTIVDYATRLKNQTEGVQSHKNFAKLDTLRRQFARAFDWGKSNDLVNNNERMSLVGVGKKMTASPNTDNPYRDQTETEIANNKKAVLESEKSAKRQADADFEDAFVNLSDKELESLIKKRNEFKLMRNDTATKKTIVEEVKK
jgi:hypothetical protein